MDFFTMLISGSLVVGLFYLLINTRAEKRANDESTLLARLAQHAGQRP
jgi:hypothetical protein